MINISQRIKETRNYAGMTQKQFAELIGIKEQSLQRYEYGKQKPGFEVLNSILQNVDISADYLFGLTDNPKGSRYDEAH